VVFRLSGLRVTLGKPRATTRRADIGDTQSKILTPVRAVSEGMHVVCTPELLDQALEAGNLSS